MKAGGQSENITVKFKCQRSYTEATTEKNTRDKAQQDGLTYLLSTFSDREEGEN